MKDYKSIQNYMDVALGSQAILQLIHGLMTCFVAMCFFFFVSLTVQESLARFWAWVNETFPPDPLVSATQQVDA